VDDSKKIIEIKPDFTQRKGADRVTLQDLNQRFNDPHQPEDKYVSTVKNMMAYSKQRPQQNLTKVEIQHEVSRNTTLALVMLPKWAVYFAPYNIARLASVTRAAGYKTWVFDYNVTAWHRLKEVMPDDPYQGHGSRDYLWLDGMYEKEIEPHLLPVLEEYLEDLVALKPTVVGFSMYYTSVLPTYWMAARLKERLPGVIIIGGGSQIQWADENNYGRYPNFDHVVKGEGEELLLELLDKIENGIPLTQYQYNADVTKRIDIDQLPFPDYSDFDLDLYLLPNAISSEISRGCVAKCTFCAETHFWKYRSRESLRILDEVDRQYHQYGTNTFWFIDSLVNGNVKELRAFALGVVERGLKIRWKGYARCDARMDLEYYQDLAASGCDDLNYGIESGSQRVLDAMKKNTTLPVIERNIRDSWSVGITNTTNWMLCFPNEETVDFAKTMTLLWRIQKYLTAVCRQTMNVGPSRVYDNPDAYNIHRNQFLTEWATKDLGNTKLHRLMRLKCFNVFIENLPIYRDGEGNNNPKDLDFNRLLRNSYELQFYRGENQEMDQLLEMPYEEFDYDIIQAPSLTTKFARSLANEPWALFRTLWRTRGCAAMDMILRFREEQDMNEYGPRLAHAGFNAEYQFSIDGSGVWTASARMTFQCPENPYLPYGNPEPDEDISQLNVDLDWSGNGHWAPVTAS
jgi:anaerobic magnesium-protoporphyrin IX monomethyl ester cyclase